MKLRDDRERAGGKLQQAPKRIRPGNGEQVTGVAQDEGFQLDRAARIRVRGVKSFGNLLLINALRAPGSSIQGLSRSRIVRGWRSMVPLHP